MWASICHYHPVSQSIENVNEVVYDTYIMASLFIFIHTGLKFQEKKQECICYPALPIRFLLNFIDVASLLSMLYVCCLCCRVGVDAEGLFFSKEKSYIQHEIFQVLINLVM